MPKYEVVKSAGFDFPVGKVFESDNLHKSMFQHVKLIDKRAAATVKPETLAADFTLADGQDGSTYEEALSLNALHGKLAEASETTTATATADDTAKADAKADTEPKVKPPPKVKPAGPGANS